MAEIENPINADEHDGGAEGDVTPEKKAPEGAGAESKPDDQGAGDGGNAGDAGDADRQRQEQEKRINDAAKAARIRAEHATEERMKRERDEEIKKLKIPNPYKKGEYFSSLKDMEEYSGSLRRKNAEERAKKENRPVEDVLQEDEDRELLRSMRQEKEAEKQTAAQKKKQEEFIAADIAEFRSKHPDVDIAKLDTNTKFRKFAGTRYGKEPLAQLYEDYREFATDVEEVAKAKAKSKAERSTGSGDGGGANALTAEQQKLLDEWNEENPHLKMTAKQFLER